MRRFINCVLQLYTGQIQYMYNLSLQLLYSLPPAHPAREPYDLPFMLGDELTIIEPCNVIFWYLAEDRHGKRGVIPITYVKVPIHVVTGGSQPHPQAVP